MLKVHLTLTGYHAGRPICDCDRSKEPVGTKYLHAVYAPIDLLKEKKVADYKEHELCAKCLEIWEEND